MVVPKMKIRLTENGIVTLYNQSGQSAKVQVLYLVQWNMIWYLRVTDSKVLSPIMLLLKMKDSFSVGDVISIKKGQMMSFNNLKEEEYQPLVDPDFNHFAIHEYQLLETRNNLTVLYQYPESVAPENVYWHALSVTVSKGDNMAESFFKEGERRLQFLKPDCKLLRERGNELYKRQEYVKALIHYDMAKQKDHFDARVWNNSSQTYFCNNEYEKAQRDALVALKLDPFNKKAYYRAAQAMEAVGEQKSSIDLLEAGMFMSGRSDDLDNLHKMITEKYLTGIKVNGTTGIKCTPNKKKLVNGDGTDAGAGLDYSPIMNGVVGKKSNLSSKPKDSPQKRLKENENKNENKKSEKNDTYSSPVATPVTSCLAGARMLYETGMFKNAFELYEVVANMKQIRDYLGKVDVVVLKFLIVICKLRSESICAEEMIPLLTNFLALDKSIAPPIIHYWLAKIYLMLDNQEKVTHHANNIILFLEGNRYVPVCWPGTKEVITEAADTYLKTWFHEGEWRPEPFAKCRYSDCIPMQGHSTAKTEIYLGDTDFRGYVEISCEECCSIVHHPCCWKATKESLCEGGQGSKKTDKDFLGTQCLTPDCSGKIFSILIYDEHSNLKNEIVKDKKDKKGNAKLKKKKDKKKEKNVSLKYDKKKIEESERKPPIQLYDVIPDDPPLPAFRKQNDQASKLTLDPLDFADSDITVLKPHTHQDDNSSKGKKQTR